MPPIRTNVGWAIEGDNLFRGHSVKEELTGRDGFWSLLSLAVGRPRLAREDAAFLDELTVCMVAADPRIWPLKICWLAGAYGSACAAMAASQAYLDAAQVGPWQLQHAAGTWCTLTPLLEQGGREAVEGWLRAVRDERRMVPGFGVARRAEDERVTVLERIVERHGRAGGPHYRTYLTTCDILRAATRLRPNIAGAFSACALDLGYAPEDIVVLAHAQLTISLWANAVDAKRQMPASLRRVDEVRYEGPPSRRSPRAGEP